MSLFDGSKPPESFQAPPLDFTESDFSGAADRKGMEEALWKSEATLQAIFHSPTYNIILIGWDGCLLAFNEGAARAAREVQGVEYRVGLDFLALVPEKARELIRERHNRVLRGESLHLEISYFGVDGVEHWYDLHYDPIKGKKGEISGVCLTNVCIDDRKKAEKNLLKSEGNLRAVFNSGPQMVVLIGKDGVLQDFNRNADFLLKSMMGNSFQVGLPFIDHLPAEFREMFRERFEGALQGKVITSERQVTARDGKEHWFEFTYNPVLGREDTVTGVCMTGVLIDERKKAEESLRRSEADLRAVFNSGSQVTVLIDRDGRVKGFNRTAVEAARRVFGRDIQAGAFFSEYLPPGASGERLQKSFEAALQGRETKGERPIRSADGVERWVEVSYQPVVNDRGGVDGVCFSVVFIDERKRAEAALKESEDRYRRLVEFSPDAVLVHDGERLLYANSAAARLFGASRSEELVGLDIWRFIRPEFRGIAVERVRRILEGKGASSPMEQEWTRLDGEPVFIEIQGIFLPYQGRPAILAILRDVAERKKTQATLLRYERLAAIGKVIAGIAHDIRNPLAVLSAMTQNLKEKFGGKAASSTEVETILSQTDRLKRFMNDILDYSRGPSLMKVPVEVQTLMTQSLQLAQAQIGPVHERVKVSWGAPEPLPVLHADQERLEQVLVNLLLNAYQAMGEGGELTLSWSASYENVLLKIGDTGPGVNEADVPNLFEPFFTTKKHGSGLGLSLSQKIVEAHGGRIEAQKLSPRGMCFTVRLPIQRLPLP